MIVYPAIDLRRGRCVRLRQGAADDEVIFADDPTEVALRWIAEGAEWLHVVNLDGALGDSADNNMSALDRILKEAGEAESSVDVQFGGGIRSLEDVDNLLQRGVARVVLGTVAVRQPEIVERALKRFGSEAIVVGIDAREGWVAIHGWLDTSTVRADELASRMRGMGVRRTVYTDIARDGMLSGVNVEATVRLARTSGLGVIASGGVASLDDIRALKAAEGEGVEGVIVGMALYRGDLDLSQALRVADMDGDRGAR